jgi:HK97 family phage portal protein
MNPIEKFVRRGAFHIAKAAGSFALPSMNDESVWTSGAYWGPAAADYMNDPAVQIAKLRGWNYICVNYNAKAVSSQTLRLYTRSGDAGKQFGGLPLTRKHLHYLKGLSSLSSYLSKGAVSPAGDAEVQEVTDHPFAQVLREVNPALDKTSLWQLTETYMGLTGSAYWWLRPNVLRQPMEIWTLEPHRTTPVPGESLDQYIKSFRYVSAWGNVTFYDPNYVIFFKTPNPNTLLAGYSPAFALSDMILIYDRMAKWELATFANMARLSGIFTSKESLTDQQRRRLKKEIRELYQGVGKNDSAIVMDGDMDFKEVGMKPKDLAHIAGRKQMREEIAGGHGIPISLLSPDASNKAIAQVAYFQYMRDTISPKLRLYEEAINTQVNYFYGDAFFVAFDPCEVEDNEFRLKQIQTHLSTGYSSVNLERAQDGEEDVPWGDKPILPMTMATFDPEKVQAPSASGKPGSGLPFGKPGEEETPLLPGSQGIPDITATPGEGHEPVALSAAEIDEVADYWAGRIVARLGIPWQART